MACCLTSRCSGRGTKRRAAELFRWASGAFMRLNTVVVLSGICWLIGCNGSLDPDHTLRMALGMNKSTALTDEAVRGTLLSKLPPGTPMVTVSKYIGRINRHRGSFGSVMRFDDEKGITVLINTARKTQSGIETYNYNISFFADSDSKLQDIYFMRHVVTAPLSDAQQGGAADAAIRPRG